MDPIMQLLLLLIAIMASHVEPCGIINKYRKIKMIIITDVWIDDANAIILALSRKNVEVLAITTTFGYVEPKQIVANANRVLRLFPDKTVNVYAGAEKPLKPPPGYKDPWEGNDSDGLGDQTGLDPMPEDSDRNAADTTASDAIFDIIQDTPGCIIVCLAPLTDLALAIRKDPDLKNLKHVYIMGGNIPGTGEQSVKPGYNFRQDPEAAEYVLSKLTCPITAIAGESYSDFNTSKTFEDDYMNTEATKKGLFVQGIRPAFLKAVGKPTLFDELAMALAIRPSVIQKSEKFGKSVTVQLSGKSKGQLVIDETAANQEQNIRVVSKFDWEKVEKMLVKSLK